MQTHDIRRATRWPATEQHTQGIDSCSWLPHAISTKRCPLLQQKICRQQSFASSLPRLCALTHTHAPRFIVHTVYLWSLQDRVTLKRLLMHSSPPLLQIQSHNRR